MSLKRNIQRVKNTNDSIAESVGNCFDFDRA